MVLAAMAVAVADLADPRAGKNTFHNGISTPINYSGSNDAVNSVVFDPGVPGDVDPTFGVGEEQ